MASADWIPSFTATMFVFRGPCPLSMFSLAWIRFNVDKALLRKCLNSPLVYPRPRPIPGFLGHPALSRNRYSDPLALTRGFGPPYHGRMEFLPSPKARRMYKAVTRGISVTVMPRFMPEESSPDQGRYFFAYTVEIINREPGRACSCGRATGASSTSAATCRRCAAPASSGEQPVLGPGESFSYTSGCPLPTPSGTMQGTYAMVTAEGETFDVEIPAFSLDSPRTKRVLHLTGFHVSQRSAADAARHAGEARLVRHRELEVATCPLIDFVESYLRGWNVACMRACRTRPATRRRSMPRSARRTAAGSCSRATPTWCRSRARPGRATRSACAWRTGAPMAAARST